MHAQFHSILTQHSQNETRTLLTNTPTLEHDNVHKSQNHAHSASGSGQHDRMRGHGSYRVWYLHTHTHKSACKHKQTIIETQHNTTRTVLLVCPSTFRTRPRGSVRFRARPAGGCSRPAPCRISHKNACTARCHLYGHGLASLMKSAQTWDIRQRQSTAFAAVVTHVVACSTSVKQQQHQQIK